MSLFAGSLISLFITEFPNALWIPALFPPILTIRGGIGGIFSGNLATMLHLGLIKPKVRDNTPIYKQLISASFAITLLDTLVMGVFSFILNFVTGQASLADIGIFILVPPVACVLAMAVSIPLTSLIGIMTFRKGLDPDILVYPILASVNDIVVTSAFAATILMIISGGVYHLVLIGLFIVILVGISWVSWQNRKVKFFIQTIKEGTTIVITSIIFGSINGTVLSSISSRIKLSGALTLYPALTNALGNIGSIIGSTSTTNLALGYSKGFREQVRESLSTILQIEAVALFMHIIFAMITNFTQVGMDIRVLLGIALLSNMSNFIVISIFALLVAQQAFKRGLNPDNVVIPVITTLSDTIVTLTLLPVFTIVMMLIK